MTEQINQFMNSVTSNNITHNRDIEMVDLDGNSKIICRCYATIVAEKSISMYMEVLEPTIFNTYRDDIQPKIDEHVLEAKELAKQYGVPIVY